MWSWECKECVKLWEGNVDGGCVENGCENATGKWQHCDCETCVTPPCPSGMWQGVNIFTYPANFDWIILITVVPLPLAGMAFVGCLTWGAPMWPPKATAIRTIIPELNSRLREAQTHSWIILFYFLHKSSSPFEHLCGWIIRVCEKGIKFPFCFFFSFSLFGGNKNYLFCSSSICSQDSFLSYCNSPFPFFLGCCHRRLRRWCQGCFRRGVSVLFIHLFFSPVHPIFVSLPPFLRTGKRTRRQRTSGMLMVLRIVWLNVFSLSSCVLWSIRMSPCVAGKKNRNFTSISYVFHPPKRQPCHS